MEKKAEPSIIILFIRSLTFSIIMPTYAVLYSFVCLASYPLPLRQRCVIVNAWARSVIWLLEVICDIHYEVEGREHISPGKNGIIMSKHQSTWETFFLPSQFHETAVILKRELKWIPFFGWGLAATDPIAINRNDKSSAMAQIIQKGTQYLKAGRWILVFPEGTRVPTGTVGRYRLGGARLAVETGYPIYPIAHNAGRVWPRRKFIKRPGTVRVVIGPPIETKDHTPEAVLAMTQDWIETTMLRIDGAL